MSVNLRGGERQARGRDPAPRQDAGRAQVILVLCHVAPLAGGRYRGNSATAVRCHGASCSIATTPRTGCTADSSWRCGTPIMTAGVSYPVGSVGVRPGGDFLTGRARSSSLSGDCDALLTGPRSTACSWDRPACCPCSLDLNPHHTRMDSAGHRASSPAELLLPSAAGGPLVGFRDQQITRIASRGNTPEFGTIGGAPDVGYSVSRSGSAAWRCSQARQSAGQPPWPDRPQVSPSTKSAAWPSPT